MGDLVVEGILNVLSGLSLFTLVFICIFAVWLMGGCDFCLNMSYGRQVFLVYLFIGRIGDLYNSCFDGNFSLLGVVRVGVIDPTCVFVWTTILDISPFPTCC